MKMKVVSSQEMRELDRITIEDYGLPSIVLMENAALATLEALLCNLGFEVLKRGVVIVCGSGNNAGDGLALARHLILRGIPTSVFLLKYPKKGDPRINLNFLNKLRADLYLLEPPEELDAETLEGLKVLPAQEFWTTLKFKLNLCSCAVDALLGTGVKGELHQVYLKAVKLINRSPAFKVSIDIPTGINPDSGELLAEEAVKANLTVTFGYLKRGLILFPGAEHVGKLIVANISIPEHLSRGILEELCLPADLARYLPYRNPLDHKYRCGSVLIIGGGKPYTGASHLASLAALKAGAGMVYLLTPEPYHQIADTKLTEVIVDTYDPEKPLIQVTKWLKRVDAVVLGMGWGEMDLTEVLKYLVESFKGPIVIDGDGIRLFAELISSREVIPKELSSYLVLTPHSGELIRFLETTLGSSSGIRFSIDSEFKRYKYAKRISLISNSVVVMKGNPTIIADLDKVKYILTTSTAMAKAGSGDVLAGMLGAFLAEAYRKASDKGQIEGNGYPRDYFLYKVASATFVHGLASQFARKRKGYLSVLATDIIEHIPEALNYMLNWTSYRDTLGYKSLIESLGFIEL